MSDNNDLSLYPRCVQPKLVEDPRTCLFKHPMNGFPQQPADDTDGPDGPFPTPTPTEEPEEPLDPPETELPSQEDANRTNFNFEADNDDADNSSSTMFSIRKFSAEDREMVETLINVRAKKLRIDRDIRRLWSCARDYLRKIVDKQRNTKKRVSKLKASLIAINKREDYSLIALQNNKKNGIALSGSTVRAGTVKIFARHSSFEVRGRTVFISGKTGDRRGYLNNSGYIFTLFIHELLHLFGFHYKALGGSRFNNRRKIFSVKANIEKQIFKGIKGSDEVDDYIYASVSRNNIRKNSKPPIRFYNASYAATYYNAIFFDSDAFNPNNFRANVRAVVVNAANIQTSNISNHDPSHTGVTSKFLYDDETEIFIFMPKVTQSLINNIVDNYPAVDLMTLGLLNDVNWVVNFRKFERFRPRDSFCREVLAPTIERFTSIEYRLKNIGPPTNTNASNIDRNFTYINDSAHRKSAGNKKIGDSIINFSDRHMYYAIREIKRKHSTRNSNGWEGIRNRAFLTEFEKVATPDNPFGIGGMLPSTDCYALGENKSVTLIIDKDTTEIRRETVVPFYIDYADGSVKIINDRRVISRSGNGLTITNRIVRGKPLYKRVFVDVFEKNQFREDRLRYVGIVIYFAGDGIVKESDKVIWDENGLYQSAFYV